MKITIGEIARQANVSTGTVSRVINGKSTVARNTRQNVLAVMKRLGYEPDPVARELSRRTKHTLGIWVGAGENRLSPYFNVIWRALMREMQLRATQFVELPVDLTPVRRKLDAVLMFHCADIDQRLATLWRRGVPGALIGHHPGISCVMPDDIGGGRLAATRLMDLGHRDLLHLTVADELAARAAGVPGSGLGVLRERAHEQGAAHMADAFSRAGGGVGVCMATPPLIFKFLN